MKALKQPLQAQAERDRRQCEADRKTRPYPDRFETAGEAEHTAKRNRNEPKTDEQYACRDIYIAQPTQTCAADDLHAVKDLENRHDH